MIKQVFLSIAILTTCANIVTGQAKKHGAAVVQGVSTTIQLPTLGVSIDANGVLTTKLTNDPQLIKKRLSEAKQNLPADLLKKSKLRKISLRKLEAELIRLGKQGKSPTDTMQHLAGLVRAEYVFIYEEENDIVIAGPAEPWIVNASGRVVGIESGAPTLLLEDLVAALRTFAPGRRLDTWVACSIDPTAKGIENFKAYQKTVPRRIAPNGRSHAAVEIAAGIQKSLGNAEVKVWGVPRETHLAQVMIEADYRMKMMAVGLEAPPIRMTTFIDALRGAPRDMQRWWFMPNYDCVRVDKQENAIQLVGQGVILSTQKIDFDKNARIVPTGTKPSSASKKYATSFTKHYSKIAEVRPVFAQLRNIIDLLVLAAWIHKSKAYDRVDWKPAHLNDEANLPIEIYADPRQAQCVANAVWKGHILILPAGGGVSINASVALSKKYLKVDESGSIERLSKSFELPADANRWWWD